MLWFADWLSSLHNPQQGGRYCYIEGKTPVVVVVRVTDTSKTQARQGQRNAAVSVDNAVVLRAFGLTITMQLPHASWCVTLSINSPEMMSDRCWAALIGHCSAGDSQSNHSLSSCVQTC